MKNIKFLYNSIIAHRGIYDNKTLFENSLPAFKKALEYNLPIELDIQLLKDNKIIVFHDNNLKRMTNIDREINTCTYDEINSIFCNYAPYKVPPLKKVLDLVDGKVPLDIEIKNDHNYKKTCQELSKLLDTYQGPFAIKSFHPKCIKWFYKNKPAYIRGILLNDKTYNKYKNILIRFLKLYCNPEFYTVKKSILTEKKIQDIRKKSIPVLTWTIKNAEEFSTITKYTDGVIFDFSNYNIKEINSKLIKNLHNITYKKNNK